MNQPVSANPPYVLGDDPERDRIWVFYGCANIELLRDPNLGEIMAKDVADCGIETFGTVAHRFSPPGEGVTAILAGASQMASVIVGASRADVHCWPEVGTMIIGFFACGDKNREVEAFVFRMSERAQPKSGFELPERRINVVQQEAIPRGWTPLILPSLETTPQIQAVRPLRRAIQ